MKGAFDIEMTVCSSSRRRDEFAQNKKDGPAPPDAALEFEQQKFDTGLLELDPSEEEFTNTSVVMRNGSLPSSRGLLMYFCHLAESGVKENIDYDFIKTLLLAGADINYSDRYKQTILHAVAKDWNTEVAAFLIERGACVNQPDRYGRTPLHVAAIFNYPKMIRCLVESGANIEATTIEWQTPLHLAAKKDSVNSVDELLKLGAKLNARDGKGKTPLHISADWGSPEVAKFLLDYGAPAGVHDNYGNLSVASMIIKMPDLASQALQQFECHDSSLRQTSYYLWTVDSTPSKLARQTKAKTVLQIAVLQNSVNVITAPVLEKLMQVKWKLFGFKYTMISVVVNLIYTLIWTVLGFLTPRNAEFYFPVKDHIWRIVLESILLIITMYYIVMQVRNIRRKNKTFNGWKVQRLNALQTELQGAHPRYPEERRCITNEIQNIKEMGGGNFLTNFWLLLETIFIILVVLTFSLRGTYEYTHELENTKSLQKRLKLAHDISYTVLLFTLWIRIMKEFRSLSFLASFITLLGHVASDTVKFGLLFMDIYIPYVCVFYMFFGGSENNTVMTKAGQRGDYFATIQQTCMTVWSVTLVADFPYQGLVAINESLAQLIVATYWALASLVCINLFIALMSETFSRVYSNAQAESSLQLASWLNEIEESLGRQEKDKVTLYMKEKCNPMLTFGGEKSLRYDPQKMKAVQIKNELDKYNLKVKQNKAVHDSNYENMKIDVSKVEQNIDDTFALLEHVNNQQKEIHQILTNSGFKKVGSMLKYFVRRSSIDDHNIQGENSNQDASDEDSKVEALPDEEPKLKRNESRLSVAFSNIPSDSTTSSVTKSFKPKYD